MVVISSVFSWINAQLLKMQWLWDLVEYIVENLFKLSMDSKIGSSIHFFIYDVLKIFILLFVLIFTISYIQSYFPPERTKKILGRFKGVKGNILGALLGTITPFCSCSSIPIFIGFTSAGLPIGVTFSFLISSPMVDIGSLILLSSFFGIKIALAYVIAGLIIAVIGGSIIEKMGMEKYIEDYVWGVEDTDLEEENLYKKQRVDYSINQVKELFKQVWIYILLGVGIGAVVHNWIPQEFIEKILGKDNPFSVLIATFVGIPIYADIFGTIPIAEALVLKGVQIGTVLAFMMGVTTLSIPSITMLSNVIKPKLLWTFIFLVSIGIIIVGYLFNIFSYVFI